MRGSKVYQTASRVLRFNTTLRSLDLKHCGMNLESAFVLAKGLGCNSTIHTLVLDGNPIGQNGARQIMVRVPAHHPTFPMAHYSFTLYQLAATRLPLAAGTAAGIEGKSATRTVSLEGCSIAHRSKQAFDPSNPAGAYVINCSGEYGQSIMLTVVEMVRQLHFAILKFCHDSEGCLDHMLLCALVLF
jgi:hypothetical protein